MREKYPLYGLTLEVPMCGAKSYEQLKSDWAAQDKSEKLTMMVQQHLVHDPQNFLPNSD
eukprot:gene33429-65921_t